LAGKSGTSPAGRTLRPAIDQLNLDQLDLDQLKVPGSTTIGPETGADIIGPPSPHDPQAGPHAGSCIGAPQAGWQG
jgi:hypothetical protein